MFISLIFLLFSLYKGVVKPSRAAAVVGLGGKALRNAGDKYQRGCCSPGPVYNITSHPVLSKNRSSASFSMPKASRGGESTRSGSRSTSRNQDQDSRSTLRNQDQDEFEEKEAVRAELESRGLQSVKDVRRWTWATFDTQTKKDKVRAELEISGLNSVEDVRRWAWATSKDQDQDQDQDQDKNLAHARKKKTHKARSLSSKVASSEPSTTLGPNFTPYLYLLDIT